jgi:hypothetical protein
MENARLRTIIATIDHQLAHRDEKQTVELTRAFAELVQVLALGPEPEVRTCPSCHKTVRLAATLCGYCWARLTPITPQKSLDRARGLVTDDGARRDGGNTTEDQPVSDERMGNLGRSAIAHTREESGS